MLKSLLEHPLTRGLDINSPETTIRRISIIRTKPFLRRIYQEWYAMLQKELPQSSVGPVLEIGSGAGFLKDSMPTVLRSECFQIPTVDVVLNGQHMPVRTSSLCAVLMTNVLHHIPNAQQFMKEAARCVKPGGILAMIEPWVTPWSSFVYAHLHHEPFNPTAKEWNLHISSGPLSCANDALPWIIFERDKKRFEEQLPEWRLNEPTLFMPFRYLLSGGVSLRSLMWNRTFRLWRALEKSLTPWMHGLAMFAKIVLVRTDTPFSQSSVV
jgi:SAM-dependent methyltransferase